MFSLPFLVRSVHCSVSAHEGWSDGRAETHIHCFCQQTNSLLFFFSGGILAAKEAAGNDDAPAQGWLSVWGDCLGLISSIGGIGYIVLGKSLRAHFPVLLFMVMNMFTASMIIILWMYAIGKGRSSRNCHCHCFACLFEKMPNLYWNVLLNSGNFSLALHSHFNVARPCRCKLGQRLQPRCFWLDEARIPASSHGNHHSSSLVRLVRSCLPPT